RYPPPPTLLPYTTLFRSRTSKCRQPHKPEGIVCRCDYCERLPMALDLALAFKTSPPPVDYVLPNMVAGTVGAIVSPGGTGKSMRSEEHTSELQSREKFLC